MDIMVYSLLWGGGNAALLPSTLSTLLPFEGRRRCQRELLRVMPARGLGSSVFGQTYNIKV